MHAELAANGVVEFASGRAPRSTTAAGTRERRLLGDTSANSRGVQWKNKCLNFFLLEDSGITEEGRE